MARLASHDGRARCPRALGRRLALDRHGLGCCCCGDGDLRTTTTAAATTTTAVAAGAVAAEAWTYAWRADGHELGDLGRDAGLHQREPRQRARGVAQARLVARIVARVRRQARSGAVGYAGRTLVLDDRLIG